MNFDKITAVTAGKTKTTGISPFSELEISKVYPNPEQPRKQFDDIEELASTIKEHGLLQPISVVKKDDGYMIISGERRYKAHLHNEAKTIKAHILNVEDEKVEELALIENIQRNDLTDFETAKHIVKLWESGRYEKKSDLAIKIGKSNSYISKAFSTLKLDDEILEDIESNKKDISVSVMDEISRVKDKEVQKEVYEKYSAGEITRDEIKEFKEPKNKRYEDEVFEVEESENFPRGILEEKFKITHIGNANFDFGLEFKEVEATFYYSNSDKAAKFDLNKKYKITIEEIEDADIKKKTEAPSTKEIKLLEIHRTFVTVRYADFDMEPSLTYVQAKELIKNSKQALIPCEIMTDKDRVYKLINKKIRTIVNDDIVFKD